MFVNSVKIDGDGEASDFEKDEVENDFYLSISKNTIQSFRHLAFFSEWSISFDVNINILPWIGSMVWW